MLILFVHHLLFYLDLQNKKKILIMFWTTDAAVDKVLDHQ